MLLQLVSEWCLRLLQAYSSVQLADAKTRWASGSTAAAEEEAAQAKQLSALLQLFLSLSQCIEQEQALADVRCCC